MSDLSALAWEFTDLKLRRLRTESEGFIARLHHEVFKPFDDLLERKAAYALAMEGEKGAIPARLLQEIEIMERFRGYVEALENITDERLMRAWLDARHEYEALARNYLMFRQLYESTDEQLAYFLNLLISIKCPQNPQP